MTRPDPSTASPLGLRRDGDHLAPILPDSDQAIPRQRWSMHAQVKGDRELPIHLTLRDSLTDPTVAAALARHCPRAAAILDSFANGEIKSRAEALKAEKEYTGILEKWRADFLGTPVARRSQRTDADSVWLQAETVFWMSRILSARYNTPTIFNVIPTEVLGTSLLSYIQMTEDETDEVAVIGDTFEPMAVPVSDAERGEVIRKLMFYKYGAFWTDRDLEIEAEIRANGRGPAWSLVDKKTTAARRAMDMQRAFIAAYGLYASKGLPGLLYGSAPADEAEELEFAGTDPETNVNNLLQLVADQSADVNWREDRVADTLAIDPATYGHLARMYYSDGVTTQQDTTLESFMKRAPNIKKIVVASEFRSQGAAAVAKLLPKFEGNATIAGRMAGGIYKEGEQRSVAMVYKADADVFAHVVGRQLETKTWPDHFGRHSTVMRESSGGVIFFEPKGARMIFRPVTGDPSL